MNWGKLPAMGISKINHLSLAMGLDNQNEYGRTPEHRTDGMFHSLAWSPLKWLGFAAHVANYEADADSGPADDQEASEVRLAALVWLWGPKSGMMGGSKKEGGIYVSRMYSSSEIESSGQEGTNSGVAVVYNVPGGWMQIHGVWDSLSCEHAGCTVSTADEGDNSANVFTLIAEYRF